uniref:Uncharacterized protein n=1 Tax=Rhizophora mucronata TaxID=61149 RepID=A0A2P2NDE5_RHIMU
MSAIEGSYRRYKLVEEAKQAVTVARANAFNNLHNKLRIEGENKIH